MSDDYIFSEILKAEGISDNLVCPLDNISHITWYRSWWLHSLTQVLKYPWHYWCWDNNYVSPYFSV